MAKKENIDKADRFLSNTDLGHRLEDNDPLLYGEVAKVMADFLESEK